MEFIKTKNAELKGEYKNTAIDDKKENAENRLIDITGNWYTIAKKCGERLSIKGKRAFAKWEKENSYVCDF